ncbi:uncharacterized protein Asalp_19660 [Aeromonas salmonicida subsp. pectinolytica 34mel]|uniref:Uncharacterized protein n=1 Tax=Aeromonas salmonicida subsp. pectinolytica 34mel TaxID=1324960 RepID=A0A2D1QFJ6_AERSA|nr:uncharacterized protein Asalp_19660 [Aeromonas salmonicida subsp. pectinolytica 34mel]
MLSAIRSPRLPIQHAWQQTKSHSATRRATASDLPPIDTSLLSYPHTNTGRNQTAIKIAFKFHGVDNVLFNRVNRHLIRFQPACLSAQEELMRSALMAT